MKKRGKMTRPELNEADVKAAVSDMLNGVPNWYCTMSVGQWDAFLQAAYERGAVLIELDDAERPIRAYRRRMVWR
jgi:Mlc titration factor MtfA (ptsG expression regulator)